MKVKLGYSEFIHKKISFFLLFIMFLALIICLFFFILLRFRPVFEEKASCAAKNRANLVLNRAVSDVFQDIDTDDIVKISEKDDLDIASISMDTVKLNKLKVKVYSSISDNISKTNTSVIYIPLGSLTDYPVLQGAGYRMPVQIVFDTSINIDFTDNIKEAGINQVYHEIFMVASANIDIVSALFITSQTVTTEIPISQTLIVGTVPNSYGGSIITQ